MLKLRIFPDPVLRKKAQPVSDFSSVKKHSEEMISLMRKHKGIGLAANQAGLLERIFVMQLADEIEASIFVNPIIENKSTEKFKYEEGCLSLPGIEANITRSKTISLRWQDVEGREHQGEFMDLASTCIQHEIDHLDGILFPDRIINPLTQQKVWKKYQKQR